MASRIDISLKNQLPEIHRLAGMVEAFFSENGLPEALSHNFNLAFDEIITNIVSYGYDDESEHLIEVRLSVDGGGLIEAEVVDGAKAFDPLSAPDPDITAELEDRPIGGPGVFFVKELMDDVRYKRENDRNHFYFCKRISA
jgi:anti-sigma regulatory factor (Ser/Thr protein kinase)